MFNVTVAAKFSTQAKIKYTDLLSLGLMYVKKFTSFYQGLKRCTQKNLVPFFCLPVYRSQTMRPSLPCLQLIRRLRSALKFVRTVLCVYFAYAKIYVRIKAIHETFLHTKNHKSVGKYTNGLSCPTAEIFRKYDG